MVKELIGALNELQRDKVTSLKRTQPFTSCLDLDSIARMLSIQRKEQEACACFVVYAAAMVFPWRQSILEEPNQPPIASARVMHPLSPTCVLVCLRCFLFSFRSITHTYKVFEHVVCFVELPGVIIVTWKAMLGIDLNQRNWTWLKVMPRGNHCGNGDFTERHVEFTGTDR